METPEKAEDVNKLIKKGALWGAVSGAVLLAALIIFTGKHFDEAQEILVVIKNAKPLWLLLAVVTEVCTYVFAGAVWHIIAQSAKYYLPLKTLARLSVEQLSINQLIPAGGVAGNVIIVKVLRRLGLSNALAAEVLFIDLLAYYVAFALVTFVSLVALSFHHHITPIVLGLVCISFLIQIFITILIWTVVNQKKLKLLGWIKKIKLISRILGTIDQISPERVFSSKILTQASLLRLGIFVFDSLTLFLVMQAIGFPHSFLTAFIVIAMASVTGAIILIPGVISGFEAGSIATLILLGLPPGGAIAITLLFRGISLWIPLIPGLIMARKDLGLA